jgi:hypothetical protein
MEHFQEIALYTADHKPAKSYQQYFHGLATWTSKVAQFLHHHESCRPTIKFTKEAEVNNTFPFLDMLFMNRFHNITTEVYTKPTHTGSYPHFKSNKPPTREKRIHL